MSEYALNNIYQDKWFITVDKGRSEEKGRTRLLRGGSVYVTIQTTKTTTLHNSCPQFSPRISLIPICQTISEKQHREKSLGLYLQTLQYFLNSCLSRIRKVVTLSWQSISVLS